MTLDQEIANASKEIYTDGYDMSIGEVISLYKENELTINPEYQRLFRWDLLRKSRFIESILLGIPVPPIFVFQNNDSTWELVDGLQRLSTILEFMGILVGSDGKILPPSSLQSTKLLPSLDGIKWESDEGQENGISKAQQISIRRSRLRVEILKKESDKQSKFELFQRLNTGGAELSDQEIRNSIMLMIKPEFYQFLKKIAESSNFLNLISLTEVAISQQRPMELVLRLIAYKYKAYAGKLDVNEYLDDAMMEVMKDDKFPYKEYESDLEDTFTLLYQCMESNAFKRYDGSRFIGAFSIAAFEAIAYGFFTNIKFWRDENIENKCEVIIKKISSLWFNPDFVKNSGAGIRGTTRIANLIPYAVEFFKK